MGHGLLVMGAKLKCSHGSTEGNLMLPDCHGVFAGFLRADSSLS